MENKDLKAMEDKDLKDLFASYNPDLSSDFSFMIRLERSLDSVEMIRERQMFQHKRQRRAMAVAVAVGFLTGILMTVILPLVCSSLILVGSMVHHQLACCVNPHISPVYYWAIIGVLSVFMTFTAYDLTLALQKNKYR